jgi:NADH:ubiquinone oxidoreductase subunit F (NADH-binding)/Pyruvate/2-oxoacid:ferredoxin oxidoreductase delta subunit
MQIKDLKKIHAEFAPRVAEKRRAFTAAHDTAFYKLQTRIALRNIDVIDPGSIQEYIGADGYLGLHRALTEMTREQVIEVITESGQRGRGGAGFLTGKKWGMVAAARGDQKYVICNADEGDPGAFMDRSILEGDPHSVIEAMTIAGYAVGAGKGYIYVRAEYPAAVAAAGAAIESARGLGLLGTDIFGTKFDFDIEIRLGAGAFVCGEETALIASIEGRRGEPGPKPPYPAVQGLYKRPTLINNVETLCVIPMIILKGAGYFNKIGTGKSPGTKVFALAGNIINPGLVEVPMGTTLKKVVYDIGGGVGTGRAVKAVQTGGPSGGCIPASMFDIDLDFESIQAAGSILGSGGLVVMDDTTCMVHIAKFFIKFSVDESCGKCVPCRIGNKKMLNLLEHITNGNARESDVQELLDLARVIKETSLCGLGQSSPNPVISTVTHFRDEYIEHAKNRRCPAGVCKNLTHFSVTDKCVGCGACKKVCPVGAISGEFRKKHTIDKEKSIRCGKCASICPVAAIVRE